MGELVHYNKIFPFTEEDKETIKKACELKDAFDENVFFFLIVKFQIRKIFTQKMIAILILHS